MNLIKICLILFSITHAVSFCTGQSAERDVDILKYIDANYVSISSVKHNYKNRDYKMIMPYYELGAQELQIGSACLFIIAKSYPEKWSEILQEEDCDNKTTYRSIALCKVKKLLAEDTTLLYKDFDLYLFFLDKKNLTEPFIEQAEGGEVYNYYPKENSPLIVYQYKDENWKKVNQLLMTGGKSIKNLALDYMRLLAIERIKEQIQK